MMVLGASMSQPWYTRNNLTLILILWVICTVFNLTKAVHIDDTVHLLVAQQIYSHPLSPYSGMLNWSDGAGPTHSIAQPPLLPYLFAAGLLVSNWDELIPHCIIALFTLGVIIYFFKITQLVACKSPLYVLSLFVLGPAFIPSQNLMTDVPSLFFWLVFFWLLMSSTEISNKIRKFIYVGLVAGVACLMKYISAVLLPIFVIITLIKKPREFLLIFTVPFLILMFWMLFSYLDYGGLHVFSKITLPNSQDLLHRACNYMVCLGGLAPFSLLLIPALFKDRWALLAVIALLLIGYIFYPISFLSTGKVALHQKLLICSFWLNGIFTFFATLIILFRQAEKSSIISFLRSQQFLFYCWILGNFFFVITFAPFVATRHVFLALAAIVIVIGRYAVPATSSFFRSFALVLTLALGFSLAVSDWSYANLYRHMAKQIRSELGDERIVTVGHWGWQWYAEKAGMVIYDMYRTEIKAGDFMVVPFNIHRQVILPEQMARLEQIETIEIPASFRTFVRTMAIEPVGGFYASTQMVGPWRLSQEPLERFIIYKARD
jgi:hypothetical protein